MTRDRIREWLRTPGGRRCLRDAAFLAGLLVVVVLAYRPSLKHPPRADQWCFLVDTMDDHTFLDAVRHTYSYNRTRQTAPGDTDLFRPVLFGLLSAEKVFFEGHIAGIQGVGIALHFAVCVLMLVVMRQSARAIRPESADEPGGGRDFLMYATLAFFALNPCVQEFVIWSHLHGYLLFLVLLLGSVSCLLRYRANPAAGWLWAGWGLAAVAAFTYELGQVYAVLAGILLPLGTATRPSFWRACAVLALFATIPVAYQTANRIDLRVHAGKYTPDNYAPLISERAFEAATVVHSARFAVFTVAQPFFPSVLETGYSGQRLYVGETVWAGRRLKTGSPTLLVSFLAVGVGLVLGLAGLCREMRERRRLSLMVVGLPALLYAGYAAMAVLGRMNLRPGPAVLTTNSYYAYPALLFALLTVSAVWGAAGDWATRLRTTLAVALLTLTAHGAEQVWRTNVGMAERDREWTRPIRAVQDFVDAHRDEPGFGFAIDYDNSDPVPVAFHHRVTDVLFRQWMTAPNPRYTVVLRNGRATPTAGEP